MQVLQVALDQCPRSLAACATGVSVALWARVDAAMLISSSSMMLVSYPPSFWMYVTNDQVLHVELGQAAACLAATWNASDYLGRWNNYGFAYRADLGLSVYLNGLPLANATYSPGGGTLCAGSWFASAQMLTVGYITSTSNTNSPQGMSVSNLALWTRYLHPIESHLFIGLTRTFQLQYSHCLYTYMYIHTLYIHVHLYTNTNVH